MDSQITSKSKSGGTTTTVQITNDTGSYREFDIVQEVTNAVSKQITIELNATSRYIEIDGVKLSAYQTKLLVEFLNQPE
jgi:hypothetical protein